MAGHSKEVAASIRGHRRSRARPGVRRPARPIPVRPGSAGSIARSCAGRPRSLHDALTRLSRTHRSDQQPDPSWRSVPRSGSEASPAIGSGPCSMLGRPNRDPPPHQPPPPLTETRSRHATCCMGGSAAAFPPRATRSSWSLRRSGAAQPASQGVDHLLDAVGFIGHTSGVLQGCDVRRTAMGITRRSFFGVLGGGAAVTAASAVGLTKLAGAAPASLGMPMAGGIVGTTSGSPTLTSARIFESRLDDGTFSARHVDELALVLDENSVVWRGGSTSWSSLVEGEQVVVFGSVDSDKAVHVDVLEVALFPFEGPVTTADHRTASAVVGEMQLTWDELTRFTRSGELASGPATVFRPGNQVSGTATADANGELRYVAHAQLVS
jgi:hypothetical protein